jgi:hypothetical protein
VRGRRCVGFQKRRGALGRLTPRTATEMIELSSHGKQKAADPSEEGNTDLECDEPVTLSDIRRINRSLLPTFQYDDEAHLINSLKRIVGGPTEAEVRRISKSSRDLAGRLSR